MNDLLTPGRRALSRNAMLPGVPPCPAEDGRGAVHRGITLLAAHCSGPNRRAERHELSFTSALNRHSVDSSAGAPGEGLK